MKILRLSSTRYKNIISTPQIYSHNSANCMFNISYVTYYKKPAFRMDHSFLNGYLDKWLKVGQM